jgi:hypothetical protein
MIWSFQQSRRAGTLALLRELLGFASVGCGFLGENFALAAKSSSSAKSALSERGEIPIFFDKRLAHCV